MGVTLRLDLDRWREHMRVVADATPGLVPVIKGNGYGYGHRRLARESALLGTDTIAVGIPSEVALVREEFDGLILVLQPWRPGDKLADELLDDDRVITVVSRAEDLQALIRMGKRPRVLVEILTAMRRHGIPANELARAVADLGELRFEGWTIHLPIGGDDRYAGAVRLARTALDARFGPLWLSHLPTEEAIGLSRQLGGTETPVPIRIRIGTRLWLGDEGSRTTVATVLDVHPVRRGERIGYRQRQSPLDGWIVVMAGGTSHGIGMEAPTPAASVRQRAVSMATGSLAAAGLALSPYTIGGKKRWFCEPPHMQASMIYLPRSQTPPQIGEEVPVELRLTTALVDTVDEV
ncbi:alanine racemase [Microlunatus endophyticus]|uniref:Alanine racemase n=1 Tax=Microlunatus endophyticus TaxID=1716077 RepID=A0A917W6C5_9ACTN|nr:alanine racemase [Microlunatus endophyticus]GGL69102.1 alanine racemase [Microlunatus endophyticus]